MSRTVTDDKLLDGLHARTLKGRSDEFAASDKAYVARLGKFVISITFPEVQRRAEEFSSVAEARQAFAELCGKIV